MNLARTGFVRSRLGRKIFFAFLFITAIPLICISLLSKELSSFVLAKATEQLLRDSVKSVALNLLDRLRSAEEILRLLDASGIADGQHAGTTARGMAIFSKIEVLQARSDEVSDKPRVRVENIGGGAQPRVFLEISDPRTGRLVVGTLNSSYLWENLESPLYTICVGGAEFIRPHCQGADRPTELTIEVDRPFYFRPYFEGEPWTLLAIAAPDISDYLPIKITEIFLYVALASLLLALTVSAFFIRRATTPLDALILATNAIRNRNFTHVIPLNGMKDEFRDVASSFNLMSATIGGDMAFMQVLSSIDDAILAHKPISSVITLALEHFANDSGFQNTRITVVDLLASEAITYEIKEDNTLKVWKEGFDGQSALDFVEAESVKIADAETVSAFLRLPPSLGKLSLEKTVEIEAFKSRIAVAISNEEHERILVTRAARDSLTKLLNRLGIVEKIDETIHSAALAQSRVAVVYLDLDGFKEINDAYGHDTGDKLLRTVADRISSALFGKHAFIARLGGDEFVFVLPANDDSFKRSIEAVLHELQHPFVIDERSVQIGASLGVAIFPTDGSGHDDLLRNADLAMYAAKSKGKNNVHYFEASLNSAAAERIELRRDLVTAIANNEFHLVYQPRVSCSDMSNSSAEALIRWIHPTRGFVPPDKFISIAEESGLIIEIGYWVLREAVNQVERWQCANNFPIRQVSVNLSPIQLMDEGFIDKVQQIFERSSVPAGAIEFEVTEGALINDIDAAIRKLTRLQEIGFTIALDDFGVGYSAMSYLSVLPFNVLKIDKSFVSGFGQQKSAYAIASAVVALANALDKDIVAEGVETQEQAAALIKMGVHELQGYLFSKPLSVPDLEVYLAKEQRSFIRR